MYYFSHKINREVKEVYWQTLLSNLAISLVFIFEPIYLFTLGYSLVHILWFYVLVYVWYAILIGFAAKITSRIGYKHSIFLSNIFYVAYWLTLYFIHGHPKLFLIAPVLWALQKSFFWPPYDADIALSDKKDQRGREVGALMSLIMMTFIISPVIGGGIAAQWGFVSLFILASVLMIISSWPLFLSREMYNRHNFKFLDLWKILKDRPRNFFGYWGFAEDLMLQSLWPLFIFLAVGNVSAVGLIATIAMLVASLLMLYIGKRSDQVDKQFLTERNSIFYGLTWIFRFFAQSIPLILVFDLLTKTLKGLVAVPMTALTFEIAGSRDHDYAIAYSVFYEFSLSIGKILTALGAIAILSYTNNIFLVFGFAGVLTMFYGLLKK